MRKVEIDDRTDRRDQLRREADLLFTSARGNAMRRNSGAGIFRNAVAAVKGCPPATYHSLRH